MPLDVAVARGSGVHAPRRSDLARHAWSASQPSFLPGEFVAAFASLAVVAVQPPDSWLGRLDASVIGCVPFLVVAAGMMTRWGVSAVVARERPPAAPWLAEPEGFSLPSRHTALAGLTVGACPSGLGAGRGTSQAAALLAAAGVGASRVCLGVHWPSDVLAGWLFTAGWLGLSSWLQSAHVLGSGPSGLGMGRSGQ
jgi:membrane-associated phospholipid phosphatase